VVIAVLRAPNAFHIRRRQRRAYKVSAPTFRDLHGSFQLRMRPVEPNSSAVSDTLILRMRPVAANSSALSDTLIYLSRDGLRLATRRATPEDTDDCNWAFF
jgi:hypothetical protein